VETGGRRRRHPLAAPGSCAEHHPVSRRAFRGVARDTGCTTSCSENPAIAGLRATDAGTAELRAADAAASKLRATHRPADDLPAAVWTTADLLPAAAGLSLGDDAGTERVSPSR